MKPFLLDTNIMVDALRKRNQRDLLVEQLLDQAAAPHEEKPTQALKAQCARRGKTRLYPDGERQGFPDAGASTLSPYLRL